MKKVLPALMLTFLFFSCKKEMSTHTGENIFLGDGTVYTLNPADGSNVKKIPISTSDFVASYRGKIEAEQQAMGREVYDFEITEVTFSRLYTSSVESLDNYLNSVNLYLDKNDGSDPIKIGTSTTLNSEMTILQSDLLSLTTTNPDYSIYYTAVFDQIPNGIKNATISCQFQLAANYKYEFKK